MLNEMGYKQLVKLLKENWIMMTKQEDRELALFNRLAVDFVKVESAERDFYEAHMDLMGFVFLCKWVRGEVK